MKVARFMIEESTDMSDETQGSSEMVERVDAGDRFVEVMFARTARQARGAAGYLARRDIPARVESDIGLSPGCGVAVLVPSTKLLSASELLAARADEDEKFAESDDSEEFDDEIEDEEDDDGPEDLEDDDEDDDDDDDEFDDEDFDDDEDV